MRSIPYTAFVFLMACGGATAPVKHTPPPPPTKVEVVQEAPPEPSAFEKKWSGACSDGGLVGQCPAPFDRAGVFLDVGEEEQAAPPFCGSLDVQDGAAARDALASKRKALKACFRGSEPGSFVELGPNGTVIHNAARKGEPRVEACVAKLVKRSLAGLKTAQPERLVVMQGSAAKPGDQVLSKESLDAVINDHAAEVSACYDSALAVWPGLGGRIASSIVLWFDGRVAMVRTGESTLDNPMLECCINTAIRSWPFPKPSDGSIALLTFPFTLGKKP